MWDEHFKFQQNSLMKRNEEIFIFFSLFFIFLNECINRYIETDMCVCLCKNPHISMNLFNFWRFISFLNAIFINMVVHPSSKWCCCAYISQSHLSPSLSLTIAPFLKHTNFFQTKIQNITKQFLCNFEDFYFVSICFYFRSIYVKSTSNTHVFFFIQTYIWCFSLCKKIDWVD